MTSSVQRTRVLQMIGSMHVGGQEQVVVHLARGLDRRRFDVAVCCTRELGVLAEQLRSESIEVMLTATPNRHLRHLSAVYVRGAFKAWKPDIIHSHGTVAALHLGPLAMLGLTPPWVHTFHYGNYGHAKGKMFAGERLFCGRATQLVAVSDAQRLAIAACHRWPLERLRTIVNGVGSNPAVGDVALRAAKRAELGVAPDDILVGSVAVLTVQKGMTYLLKAAPAILREHPRARFIIVGGGPLEQPLREEARALGIEPRVILTGWRADSQQVLAALDLLVMPSLWEAMPMVLLEGMAARLPIVVTDVGDNQSVVDDGRCGRVVPAKDPQALATAVSELIAHPETGRELAARAQARFCERFMLSSMVDNYARLYERLLDRRTQQEPQACASPSSLT